MMQNLLGTFKESGENVGNDWKVRHYSCCKDL